MARACVSRRLLRRLSFDDVKLVNEHFEQPPRKSKEMMISQVVSQVGTGLEVLVSSVGPFSWVKWNKIVENLGGAPRNSFELVAEEIEASLDPAFDELDGNITISVLRNNKAALRTLAGKLGINRTDLEIQLRDTNGHTQLSTFVADIRNTQNNPIREPQTHVSVRVASTRVSADSIEKLSQSWMLNHMDGADHIAIAAGFYDVEFVQALLHKHSTVQSIRLLFNGLGGQRLVQQREELEVLERHLRKEGRSVEIRLAFAPGMFHTKLFLVTESGATRALVGSANATKAAFGRNKEIARNEEILVALPDAGALIGYFKSAWDSITTKKLNDIETAAKSLIAFFRTGVLYFKPVATLTTTLNPFGQLFKLMTNDELALISKIVLPHAEQTTGIGSFSLVRAIEGSVNVNEVDDDEKGTNAGIKPFSVETCFGYWVPSAFDEAWKKKLDEASEQKKKRKIAFLNKLKVAPDGEFVRKYQEYLDAVKKELNVIPNLPGYLKNLKQDPFDVSLFDKFFERVLMHLEDGDRLNRLTMPFISGAIPEIWDDAPAYRDFCTSFFEYLEHVASSEKNRPHAPNKILEKINFDESPDSEQIRLQLEEYLQLHGWTDDDWGRRYRSVSS